MIDVYNETIETSNKIKNAGYKLKEMWECDYNKMCELVNKCYVNVLPEHVKRNYRILKEHINNIDLEYFKHIKPIYFYIFCFVFFNQYYFSKSIK